MTEQKNPKLLRSLQNVQCDSTNFDIILATKVEGGDVCGRAVNTSNSGSGGLEFKPRPSRCFLRPLHPGV